MNTKNIGIFTHHNFPCDQEVRIHKLLQTLKSDKYSTFVFCPGDIGEKKNSNFNETLVTKNIPSRNSIFSKLKHVRIPINIFWAFWAFKQIKYSDISLVIIRDLRLFLPVTLAARILRVKVILDIGEHYPGMMEILGKSKISHHLIRNKYLIIFLEKISILLADFVWVVVEENKTRLQNYNPNIEVINNYPMDNYLWKSVKPKILNQYFTGQSFVIVSFGLIDNIRGLDFAIEVMRHLKTSDLNITLDIIGDGYYKKNLQQKVSEYNLENHIFFKGWVKSDERYNVLAGYDLGVIFHDVCDLTNNTIPNKLFDYMAVGLPVVTKKLKPIMKIIEKEYCGISVNDRASDAASDIENLLNDSELRKRFSQNGRAAMENDYSWKDEQNKILKRVDNMVRD